MSHLTCPGPRTLRARATFPAVALLVGAGLLLAQAAAATTYYVATNGSDSNPGTSSGSPWRTIGKASSTMVAGDVVRISPGTYSETLQPVANGTSANRITYMGNISNPSGVVVNAIQFYGQDYISIKGITSNGEINVLANTSGNSADRDSILYCVGRSGLSMSGAWYSVLANSSIGTGDATDKVNFSAYPGDNRTPQASVTQWCTIQDCTFNLATLNGGNAMTGYYMRNNRFLRNRYRITMLAGASDTHSNTLYRCVNNQWIDCRYTLKNLAGYEVYILNQRDSSRFNVWVRDTFEVDPTSTMSVKCEFATSGSYPQTVRYNSWTNCVFKVDGICGYQNPGYGDRIEGNVFTLKQAWTPKGDSMVVRHNTFYNSTGPIVWDTQQVDLTRSSVVGNLFYGSGAATNAHVYIPDAASNRADSNLYYATGNDPARAVYSRSGSVFSAVGSGTAWCSTYGKDCNSLWSNPQLMAASWNAPDLRPANGSPAYASRWPDGYAGAFPASSLIGDTTPPNAIANLAAGQPAENSVLLSWTAPGDDGSSGIAAAYDIRWSTSPIDAGNFASATPFTSVPDPLSAGQPQTFVALGLQPSTQYWFAIRTRDESTNWSAVSNVATATTTAPDATPPAAINDLGASP
ncbi:MAG: DUF1565 domain-containing protein [Candidatus Eisenbacteria bacterium]|nr:DUF1565 domain-containing protein [Candidatus Eisenbacteria bacterium]